MEPGPTRTPGWARAGGSRWEREAGEKVEDAKAAALLRDSPLCPDKSSQPSPPAMSAPLEPSDCVTVHMATEEVQLQPRLDPHLVSTTTGGVEGSCYRCVLPFSLVAVLIGAVMTALAYAQDAHGSVLWALGMALLSTGVLGLAGSCLSRKVRRWRQGSFTLLVGDQPQKVMV
ncbi:transmembrane protein 100-like [Carettochelys insculpta]|uniref:transmembrane protein 100-like n=1 Tax=Carettochelys insculpta TaxID=44489 RepID=UPI003EBDA109